LIVIPARYGLLLLLCLGCSLPAVAATDSPAIEGTWEGESKCTVPDSPCHDEHVVYEVKADAKAADHFTIDAYKIVSGERDFMGTLDCHSPEQPGVLRCIGRRPDDVWLFNVSGNAMSGTLTMGPEKQLFRRVRVTRQTSTPAK
jgi:hypothetical protein